MRIAGGVLILIAGLWSLIGGGCSVLGGGLVSKGGDVAAQMAKAAAESGAKVKIDKEAQEAMDKVSGAGSGLMISGVIILIAGILCIVAGIMFFVNKGKGFCMVAPGIGVLGEILFFALVAFNIAGVIKLLIYGFGIFAATKVGAES